MGSLLVISGELLQETLELLEHPGEDGLGVVDVPKGVVVHPGPVSDHGHVPGVLLELLHDVLPLLVGDRDPCRP